MLAAGDEGGWSDRSLPASEKLAPVIGCICVYFLPIFVLRTFVKITLGCLPFNNKLIIACWELLKSHGFNKIFLQIYCLCIRPCIFTRIMFTSLTIYKTVLFAEEETQTSLDQDSLPRFFLLASMTNTSICDSKEVNVQCRHMQILVHLFTAKCWKWCHYGLTNCPESPKRKF